MYYGKKDWRPQIEVPAELCYERQLSGKTLIEIRIPDKKYPEITNCFQNNINQTYVNWKSFMVQPEQVFHKTDKINTIDGLTQGSAISICCHIADSNGAYTMDRTTIETIDVFEIIRRIHAFYI